MFINKFRCFRHLIKAQGFVTADIQNDAPGAVQGPLDERTGDGFLHRLNDSPLSAGSNPQNRIAAVTLPKNRPHVSEINIDDPGGQYHLRNTANGLPQHFICCLKCLDHGHFPIL